jgi:GNAT superfamily N-acetyltransferase
VDELIADTTLERRRDLDTLYEKLRRELELLVRDDLLGKGIGSLLISKCIDSARDAGFASMVVKTETSNERAINFYTKKGFVRIGNVVEAVENSKAQLVILRLVL